MANHALFRILVILGHLVQIKNQLTNFLFVSLHEWSRFLQFSSQMLFLTCESIIGAGEHIRFKFHLCGHFLWFLNLVLQQVALIENLAVPSFVIAELFRFDFHFPHQALNSFSCFGNGTFLFCIFGFQLSDLLYFVFKQCF